MDKQESEHSFVARFGRTTRLAHWWVFGFFAATVVTAPEAPRGDTPLLVVHITCATALVLGVIAVALGGNHKTFMADLRALKFDGTDRTWLRSARGHSRNADPVRWGKFNTGQKVMARLLLLLIVAVLGTGLHDTLSGSASIHPAFIGVCVFVLLGHVFIAAVNPATRPSLRGMLRGTVDRTWARHHHPAWLDEVEHSPETDS